MRIGIDACTWANLRGYGRFTRQLVTSMITEHPEHRFVLVVDQITAAEGNFPEEAQLEIVQTSEQPTQAASADSARRIGDLWRLSRAVSRLRLDAFFFPTRYSYYPLFCRTPTVVAFHDATGERHPKLIFPGWRSRLFWRLKSRLALHRATRLVTVSEDARAQLSEVFRLPPSTFEVITEGPDPCFQPIAPDSASASMLAGYQVPAGVPVVIYVGGISPHKNLQGLLQAMALLKTTPWHLLLVGDYSKDSFYGCYQEVLELSRSLALSERVTFTGFVSDADLVALYNLSTLLVLPSFSEGFGLPVIEAMACGLPVAASNRNSLPEIIGDAGLLFDPLSPGEISAAIGRLLSDAELREELRARGLRRAETFSWKAGAGKLVSVLEAAVDDRR